MVETKTVSIDLTLDELGEVGIALATRKGRIRKQIGDAPYSPWDKALGHANDAYEKVVNARDQLLSEGE